MISCMRFFVSLLFVAALCAQPPQGGGRAPQNLKVLKVEGAQIGQIMRSYTTGLGVRCDFCHVQGNFASDDNPHKEIARKMIVLTREINTKFPDGKAHVTCYTCHRGAEEPQTAPPPAAASQ